MVLGEKVSFFNYRRVFESKEDLIIGKISEIIKSGVFINGDEIRLFESKMTEYFGRTFLACSNGTDALTVAFLYAKSITDKREVLVPSFTFVSSAMSATKIGFDVRFIDIDRDRFCPKVEDVIRIISKDTAAIVWPHLFGYTEDLMFLRTYCDEKNILLIEDCAQSLGSISSAGKKTGTVGHISTFSFFPVKNLGAFGDAGGLLVGSEDMRMSVKSIISHGCLKKYHPKSIGGNYRMDTIQAGVLNVLFDTLESQVLKRKTNAERYLSSITNKNIFLPLDKEGNSWNQFTIMVENRDDLVALLNEKNIGFEIYYPIGLHRTEVYSGLYEDLPNTDRACHSVLSLPIYPGLLEEEIEYIIEVLNSFEA